MSNKKTIKVFSTASIAGMIAAAVVSSQAFAAVDAYSVKVGDQVYKYDKAELTKSFLNSKRSQDAKLYDDFVAKLTEAKGFYAFNDTKNGYVDFNSIQAKFKEAKRAAQQFNLDEFTESKDAKVIKVEAVKKAVVNKDGKVEYVDEVKKDDDEKAALDVASVEALNLKQVKINFNKTITDQDKIDDVEDESNYTIKDKDNKEVKDCIDKVELDKDGKFAILTFKDKFKDNGDYKRTKDTDEGIKNQETYSIEFDSNITGKEDSKTVKFNDFEFPKVKSIEIVGSDSIKIKFSKPVRPVKKQGGIVQLDTDDVKINDDNISVSKIELSNDNTEATVKLAYTLKNDKQIKVEVKGTIEDYTGYGVQSEEKELTVKKDEAKPDVVGYKDVKKGKATLIFNRDIKFDGDESKVKVAVKLAGVSNGDKDSIQDKNGDVREWNKLSDRAKAAIKASDNFKDYYHTNDSNKAYAIKIDGKEMTLYFNEDDNGLASESYINIKANKIKTLWNIKNEKIVKKVIRSIDNTKLVIKSIEQDENNAKKITVKFNKEVDGTTAGKTSNYELKDEDGVKWNIASAEKDTDNNKKVILETSKKLSSGKYTLTIKDVEDVDGKAIEKSSKEFTAKERDARTSDDIKDKVSMYNPGKNDQKIIVDFDTKMKNNKDENSISNIKKYSLVAKLGNTPVNAFDNGKSSILVDKLYNSTIKVIQNDHKAELNVPFKSGKDDSYDFSKYYKKADGTYIKVSEHKTEALEPKVDAKQKEYYKIGDNVFDTLEIHVGNVSDADENVNPTELVATVKDADTVKVDEEDKLPLVRAISTDKIQVTFDDQLDFKNGDVFLTRGVPTRDADGKVTNEVVVSEWSAEPKDGKTVVTMTLAKNQDGSEAEKYDDDKEDHVLRYDGTLDGDKVYFNTIAQPESKNNYDAYLQHEKDPIAVIDAIAPQLVDNNIREDGHKYKGNGVENGDIDNNDKAVEYYRANGSDQGRIVLTFTEDLDKDTVTKNSFRLDSNSDYETVRIEDTKVVNGNKVVISVSGLNGIDTKSNSEFGLGFDVVQNQPIADKSDINRGQGNQVSGINTEIGNFGNLADATDGVAQMIKDETNEEVASELNRIQNSRAAMGKVEIDEKASNKFEMKVTDAAAKLNTIFNSEDITYDVKPDVIKLDGKEINVKDTKVVDVKKAIAEYAGKANYADVTLGDLVGKNAKVVINGQEYTLDVIANAPAAHH